MFTDLTERGLVAEKIKEPSRVWLESKGYLLGKSLSGTARVDYAFSHCKKKQS